VDVVEVVDEVVLVEEIVEVYVDEVVAVEVVVSVMLVVVLPVSLPSASESIDDSRLAAIPSLSRRYGVSSHSITRLFLASAT